MEILATIIPFLLVIGLVMCPVLVFFHVDRAEIQPKFSVFILFSVATTLIITVVLAWWTDFSTTLLLYGYGYDFDAWNDAERMAHVSDVDVKRVKALEASMTGVGWPLRALLTYFAYFPYQLLIYVIGHLVTRSRNPASKSAKS